MPTVYPTKTMNKREYKILTKNQVRQVDERNYRSMQLTIPDINAM